MSLHPQETYRIPEDTARVARAIFPTGNLVMRIADELHRIVHDRDFADLFPTRGQPAEAPGRLALVTRLQFMEALTDRQAAEAVRTRIDWKYLLGLELTDVGFDHTVLSEFRTRLLAHDAERRLFEGTLDLARTQGLLKAGGRQRSDSTHVLGAMRTLNRLEAVTETLRAALNGLATAAPTWLREWTTPEWVDRYGLRASEFRLPKGEAARQAWATRTGADGMGLFAGTLRGARRRTHATRPARATGGGNAAAGLGAELLRGAHAGRAAARVAGE
jgi:transposase